MGRCAVAALIELLIYALLFCKEIAADKQTYRTNREPRTPFSGTGHREVKHLSWVCDIAYILSGISTKNKGDRLGHVVRHSSHPQSL
jgi:hypothetical protein